MNLNKQFFWFLMNAVLMCIFIVPVAVAFWLSAFAAGFDWSQWVKLAADTANRAASDPAKALGTVQTYWGILSFFLLAAYSLMFKFKANANKEVKTLGWPDQPMKLALRLRKNIRKRFLKINNRSSKRKKGGLGRLFYLSLEVPEKGAKPWQKISDPE